MQLGLVYSNAATFRAARRWVAQSGTRPADKVAVRLARYVSRAAAKTSPFTLFTSSGLGSWREGGPVLAMRDTQPRSAVELGLATLQQVVTGLAGRPSTAAHLLVRVNPTVTVDGDVVRFVAPGGHGPARAVRRTPALDALLPGLPPGQTRAALGDWLAGHVGDPARADEFVDRLLRMGLLELYLPVADQALHPRAVLAWLDERAAGLSGDPGVAELRAVLRRLADLLDEYASATVPAVRLACREQLDAAVGELAACASPPEIRAEPPDRPDPSGQPAFYENAMHAGECLTADARRWAGPLDDLAAVARFGRLYDPGLPARLVLPGFVAERYGPGARVPFLRFYAAYEAELRSGQRPAGALVAATDLDPVRLWSLSGQAGAAAPDLSASPIPDLARLGRLRQASAVLLRRRCRPGGHDRPGRAAAGGRRLPRPAARGGRNAVLLRPAVRHR